MARTLTLVFDEYPDEEIVLRTAPVPMSDYLAIAGLWDESRRKGGDLIGLMRRFGDVALVSWTFPEPATGEGMMARDLNLGIALVAHWMKGVRDVPLPLPVPSSAGDDFTPASSPAS